MSNYVATVSDVAGGLEKILVHWRNMLSDITVLHLRSSLLVKVLS